MTEWNKTFPLPNRSDHEPQQDAHREFYPEIDMGRGEIVMNDGRPAVIEDWFDSECEIACRTAFYSTIGIENWSEAEHHAYLKANGVLKGKDYPTDGVGHKKLVDPSGNEIWSATVVMGKF